MSMTHIAMTQRRARAWAARLLLVPALLGLVACSTGPAATPTASAPTAAAGLAAPLAVVAAENFWGDIVQQIGGTRVTVRHPVTRTSTRTSTSRTCRTASR